MPQQNVIHVLEIHPFQTPLHWTLMALFYGLVIIIKTKKKKTSLIPLSWAVLSNRNVITDKYIINCIYLIISRSQNWILNKAHHFQNFDTGNEVLLLVKKYATKSQQILFGACEVGKNLL